MRTEDGDWRLRRQRSMGHPGSKSGCYEHTKLAATGTELVLEQFITFESEISVIVARSPQGEIKTFPPAENIHMDNILHASIVPARVAAESRLKRKSGSSGGRIDEGCWTAGCGTVCSGGWRLYVNELAPRPHNSGHYTMEACATSQFEQHIRAICGLPLGDTSLLSPVVMVNVLGEHLEGIIARTGQPDVEAIELGVIPKLHLYGKTEAKTERKMGHVNLLCHDVEEGLQWIEQTNLWRNTNS